MKHHPRMQCIARPPFAPRHTRREDAPARPRTEPTKLLDWPADSLRRGAGAGLGAAGAAATGAGLGAALIFSVPVGAAFFTATGAGGGGGGAAALGLGAGGAALGAGRGAGPADAPPPVSRLRGPVMPSGPLVSTTEYAPRAAVPTRPSAVSGARSRASLSPSCDGRRNVRVSRATWLYAP